MIGLIFYIPGLMWGAVCADALSRVQAEATQATHGNADTAAGAAFFSAGIGAGLGFIVFWGLPAAPARSGGAYSAVPRS